jgi:hypothetical protein
MDAIIGRYRVRMEEGGTLVLQHPTGLMFEMTAEETLGLMDFIQVYRKTLMALERETDAEMQRVVVPERVEQADRLQEPQ